MGEEGGEPLDGDYSELKDLRISLDRRVVNGGGDGGGAGFCLCFWMYLKSPISPSTVVLRQMHSETSNEVPFLSLNEEEKIILFPLFVLHDEAPSGISVSYDNISSAVAKIGCLSDKWIHVGCEALVCLQQALKTITTVAEKSLSSFSKNPDQDILEGISLAGNDGCDKCLEGYIHDLQIFPLSSYRIINDLSTKNLPIRLALDCSHISDGVEEECNGVWNIVGGKASCRRKFSLDVALLDAFGFTVHREFELIASLVYADNGTAVKKPHDNAEAPLLIHCDGLEFPSTERTVKLIDGRASIKLKISQLSSKCENRLFRIHFYAPGAQRYPFLEAHSPPIRCISRSRHNRGSFVLGRKRSHSMGAEERSHEIHDNCSVMQLSNESDSKSSCPSSKHIEYGYDDSHVRVEANESFQGHRLNSHNLTSNGGNVDGTYMDAKFEHHVGSDTVLSDSESTDARNSVFRKLDDGRKSISDATVFKYCLEGTEERSFILRDVISFACDEDIMSFAEQISLYAGCRHHRYQILIAKQLINEGNDSWRSVSRNDNRVLWSDLIPEIDRKFRKISCSISRGLSRKDLEVLRRITACGEDLAREDFDRLWHWLFPVAFTLSKDHINALWESMSPMWIEGIVTKEEAEASLRGPGGHLEPGTFVLRFPTSRSWPHPDAGSLVVTYVGADYALHNRLLAVDDSLPTRFFSWDLAAPRFIIFLSKKSFYYLLIMNQLSKCMIVSNN
ncbi:unnamed protein product [Spirodela intermedia]|uniref:SH2 domain-containing protein n=1 Tax=Spirodela intermedia TaxID=51605 RepID=A0A7I8K6G0_SPIIN|nr:unnamed protein product [Spirodela intermedia]